MKLSNRQRRTERMELSMTSMIDVVFLLLIFFLVTTTFLNPEQQLTSGLPSTQQEGTSEQQELEPAVIEIQWRNGKVIYRLGAIVTDRLEQLEPTLASWENKSLGAFVQVSDQVPFDAAAKAIGICKANGFRNVSYLPHK